MGLRWCGAGGCETHVAVAGLEGRAEDAEDRAGRGVEDRSPGRAAAEAECVAAGGADRQLQGAVEEMEAVGGRVRHGGDVEDAGLAPASGEEADVSAGLDRVPDRDGERVDAEALGVDEGQVQGGQRGHGVGGQQAGAVVGGVHHDPGQAVHDFVTGDDRALVVGDESGAARASRQVVDADEDFVAPPLHARVGTYAARRPASASGPRAPSRHGRTSPRPPVLVFDRRHKMISGTDRAANAPPSAPSVHSERLPGRVNRRGPVDTP